MKLISSLRSITNVAQSLSRFELRFMVLVSICANLVLLDYGVIHPTANSLILGPFTSKALPWAWITTLVLLFLMTTLFNRLLSIFPVDRLFVASAIIIAATNWLFAIFIPRFGWLTFAFYVWKDAYILIMVEQIWALVNSTLDSGKAGALYGPMTAIGGVGATLGNLFCREAAQTIGSSNLLFATLPIYGLLLIAYLMATRTRDHIPALISAKTRIAADAFSEKSGYRLIANSRLIFSIALFVCFMQMATAFTDFQLNRIIESTIQATDVRTHFFGSLFAKINLSTTVLQLIVIGPFIYWIGLKGAHMIIPVLLLLTTGVFLIFPTLPVISFVFWWLKTLDYSLFRVSKEILYIPCTVEEKYKTKSIIDIFFYRGMKAVSSVMILLVLSRVDSPIIFKLLSGFLIVLYLVWLGCVPQAIRAYRNRSSSS